MRDIRQDLKERLDAIDRDRVVLQNQLDILSTREASIKAMLADEERRILSRGAGTGELPFESATLVGGMQMTDLIKSVLRGRRLTFDDVKVDIVKTSFDFAGQKPGRVIHGGLLSLWRAGEIDKDASGRYFFREEKKIPVQEKTN